MIAVSLEMSDEPNLKMVVIQIIILTQTGWELC